MGQSKQCIIGVFVLVICHVAYSQTGLIVRDLRCEYKTNPLGLGEKQPRLSWLLSAQEHNTLQTAYRIQVSTSVQINANKNDLWWDSGRVKTDQSVHVMYEGPELQSGQRLYWRVRVWDNQAHRSSWSEPAFWEMGLLQQGDWQAQWIEPDLVEDVNTSNPCPLLRSQTNLLKPIKQGRLYVTAHGLYEMYINGQRVGDQVFTPGWTSYGQRLQVQTYDVTHTLQQGENALGAILGDGWYRGRLIWENTRNFYGTKSALLAQLTVTYEDGSVEILGTNETWKASTGPILLSDIYDGETYDARLEKTGWTKTSYDDSDWAGVKVASYDLKNLIASDGVPVREIEEIQPLRVITTPKGETVVDMGQNLVGWLRLQVQGTAGTEVTLTHFEVLDKQGNVYLENLRSAKQQVKYTLKGQGAETYAPRFTFQGFRFVQVEGWPGELTTDDLTGIVIHSDMPKTGSFSCSNKLINQLQQNIQWGLKGNFLDVPTDCPQRDERLGWTGDAQVFARTACFLNDTAAFYTKWLADVAADQTEQGAVPHVVPDVLSMGRNKTQAASAGWADVATVLPWTMYLSYGDRRILERQYASMKAWVDYMAGRAGDSSFWHQDFTFGDWLSYNSTKSDYPGAFTDKDLICQAHFARSTDLLLRAAKILGKEEDVTIYSELLTKVKKVFLDEFVTPNGRMASSTQTAYALALGFELLPEAQREAAAARLVADVRKFKHITTGFLGTPLICHVLSDFGYEKEAFMLLNRKQYPSWLYPVTQGATTIWERWDGQKPDGTFQSKGMNSFNHYAYGAIGEWLYRYVAGIEIDASQPGYKHILIQPHPGGGLTHAQAHLDSLYGRIASHWIIKDQSLVLEIEIPANTSATVSLPRAMLASVTTGDTHVLRSAHQQGDAVVVSVGSGSYRFEYPMKN
ncbi:family 78 glycoside hydrolase catalytic domain [Planctomycetota bacterium]